MNPDPNAAAGTAALAARAWASMQAFVTGEDRRRALRVELDLGIAKAELLVKLTQAPMTLREIAHAIDVDPSAATVGVDRLERRGFVQRRPHPDDARSKLVHLTDAGLKAAATAQRILSEPPATLNTLDASDLAALTRIFSTLGSAPQTDSTAPAADR